MESKVCVVCNPEKSVDNFYNKYRECKQFNIKRSSKRYSKNKGQLSNETKICYEKSRDVLPAKSKVNHQKKKSHTQQIEELNNKAEELTRAMEILLSEIE